MRIDFEARPGRLDAWAWFATALIFTAVLPPAGSTAAERRGGIEIGAKGVKATAVEVTDGPGGPKIKVILNKVANTTVVAGVVETGKYSPDAIRETAAEAGKFAGAMRDELGIPADKIRIIGSSGLPPGANRAELVEAVKAATSNPSVEILTPCREVELTILGLVPAPDRKNAILLDVGSGNTKGGLIGTGKGILCLSVPLGSVTYAGRVSRDAPGVPFQEAAARLRRELLDAPLTEQIRKSPEFSARRLVFLNGGAVYAMATLLHPEAVRQERVSLSAKDIDVYLGRLQATPTVPVPDLGSISDPETRAAADQEVRTVLDLFTRESLIAGAEVLAALSSTLDFKDKTLIFDRTGVTAWIRASLNDPEQLKPEPPPALEESQAAGEKARTGQGRNSRRTETVSPSPQSSPSREEAGP